MEAAWLVLAIKAPITQAQRSVTFIETLALEDAQQRRARCCRLCIEIMWYQQMPVSLCRMPVLNCRSDRHCP